MYSIFLFWDIIELSVILDLLIIVFLQLQRKEITLHQLSQDLVQAKEQYNDAIEENGRLEARIQAFAINCQSEQDVLSTEVSALHGFIHSVQRLVHFMALYIQYRG